MKIRKVLGGFAWVMLAAGLIMVNAVSGSAGEGPAVAENTGVLSSVE